MNASSKNRISPEYTAMRAATCVGFSAAGVSGTRAGAGAEGVGRSGTGATAADMTLAVRGERDGRGLPHGCSLLTPPPSYDEDSGDGSHVVVPTGSVENAPRKPGAAQRDTAYAPNVGDIGQWVRVEHEQVGSATDLHG